MIYANPYRPIRPFTLPLILAFFLMLFSACGQQGEENTLDIYYVNEDTVVSGGHSVYDVYSIPFSAQAATPDALIDQLLHPPDDGGASPLPGDTVLLSCTVNDGVALVDLSSDDFPTGYNLTVAQYSVALTLTQLDEIDAVQITLNGQSLADGGARLLYPDEAVLSSSRQELVSTEVALYFFERSSSALQAEYRTLVWQEEAELARQIVNALIDGPESNDLQRLLPGDTELLSLTLTDGACQILLSDSFWINVSSAPQVQQLTIDSIVDSLTNLEFVTEVQFLPQDPGQPLMYGEIFVEEPFGADES